MNDNKKDIKVGQIFNNYEQFFSTFKTFCDENYQPLIVTNNNKRQVTILCRHGYVRPSNSTGKRTKLCYNYRGCKAKITCFKPANSTRVKITGVSLEHNHEISRTAFRGAKMKLIGEKTDVLKDIRDANCKVSQINQVFQSKFYKKISSQKIRNLLQKLNPKSSDESGPQTFLEGIEEAGGDVVGKIDIDGNVSVLCISSHIMKKSFQASCSTVVQIDTFDFDMSEYKLCAFCYLNPTTNKSEICMLAFLSKETSSNFRMAFSVFKTICTPHTNIFIVDKDFNEVSVLKELFENARILLCTFHVIKYVKNLIATVPVVVEIKNEIMTKFKNMLYAQSNHLYDESKNIFLASFNDVQIRVNMKYVLLKDYFINDWDSCKIMWVKCFRKNLPTLRDNTNNRIERSFWTLKQILHTRFSSLPEISQSIVHLVSFCSERLTESTSTANLRSLKIYNKDFDIFKLNAEASLALNDRGCVLFHESLEALHGRREFMKLECNGVREQYEEDEVVYKCSNTECTCTFYVDNQSPCRHILLTREQQCGSLSAVFELSLFHSRYHQQRNVIMDLNSTTIHNFDEIEDRAQLNEIEDRVELDEVEVPVLSYREKYNMMLPITLSIASLSAYHGTNQFQYYLKGMKEVERIVRSGSTIENCSLLTVSTCASTQAKSMLTQAIQPPVQQALDDENNGEGTSATLEHQSKPAKLTGRFHLKFKEKLKAENRPKGALK